MSANEKDELLEIKKQGYVNAISNKLSGKTIEISGKIVDKNGNLINNVGIELSLARNVMFAEKDERVQIISPDGYFLFKYDGYTCITLYFSTDAFFDVNSKGYTLKREVEYKTENFGSVVYKDIEIVMHKIGETAKTKFADIIWNRIMLRQLDVNIIPLTTLKHQVLNKDNLNYPSKYFIINKGDLQKKHNELDPEFQFYLTYISKNPDDGFLEVESTEELGLRGLTEAPESGYELKQLPLFFPRGNNNKTYRYYYFKNGYHYGKIKLYRSTTNAEKDAINVRFYIVTNKERDIKQRRNLRSYSDAYRY